jgi:NAD(P)H-dependent FMN reductase
MQSRMRIGGSNGFPKISVVVGSIRRDSINRKLAQALMRLAPEDFQLEMLRIDDLPVFNQDHDRNPVEPVVRLKAQIAAADGLLFVTPEHNRSIPSALKNALDWRSRPYGQNTATSRTQNEALSSLVMMMVMLVMIGALLGG